MTDTPARRVADDGSPAWPDEPGAAPVARIRRNAEIWVAGVAAA